MCELVKFKYAISGLRSRTTHNKGKYWLIKLKIKLIKSCRASTRIGALLAYRSFRGSNSGLFSGFDVSLSASGSSTPKFEALILKVSSSSDLYGNLHMGVIPKLIMYFNRNAPKRFKIPDIYNINSPCAVEDFQISFFLKRYRNFPKLC